jgi:hypothetical protein
MCNGRVSKETLLEDDKGKMSLGNPFTSQLILETKNPILRERKREMAERNNGRRRDKNYH